MSPQMRPYTFKEHVDEPISRPGTVPPPVPPKNDRKCGVKKRTFYILVGCVLIWIMALALGLGLGLGLGLKKDKDNNSYASPSPALTLSTVDMTQWCKQSRSFLSAEAGVLHRRRPQRRLLLQEGCL